MSRRFARSLRTMKLHNQKVVGEISSVGGQKIVAVTVDKAVTSGLIRPGEKQVFEHVSQRNSTHTCYQPSLVSFDSVETGK